MSRSSLLRLPPLFLAPALLATTLHAQEPQPLVVVHATSVGVDLATGAPLALLRNEAWGQIVPIWIGGAEAESIARALAGAPTPRPMTHDLLASAIAEMGGTVEEVAVHAMENDTFLGRIRIRVRGEGGERTVDIDSRPSDALALAVRTGATVRVAPAILATAPDVNFLATDGNAEVVRSMGMTVTRSNQARRREFSLPNRAGMVVLHVGPQIAALGLQRGDLLVDVNGEVPTAPLQFIEALNHVHPTAAIRIVYVRDGVDALLQIPPSRPVAPRLTGQ